MPEPDRTCKRDYPDGRGIFLGREDEFCEDSTFSIWLNETEHCSIVAKEKNGDLQALLERAFNAHEALEKGLNERSLEFIFDDHFGHLTSDPLSSGTGISVTVELNIPLLSQHDKFKRVMANLRLRVKQISNKCILISNQDLHGVSECTILQSFIDGITTLVSLEEKLHKRQKISLPEPISVPWNEKAELLRLRVSKCGKKFEDLSSAPFSILVSGRRGTNNVINGIYVKCRKLFNGKPAWEKVTTERIVVLRWHSAGYWIFDDNFVGGLKGFAFAKTDATYPINQDIKWHVFHRRSFDQDPGLRVCTHGRGNRYAEEEDIIKACSQMIEDFPHNSRPVFPELRSLSMSATYRQIRSRSIEHIAESAPDTICVSGDNPCSFFINGTYVKADSLHEERAYWRKSDGSYSAVIRWHPKGLWIISDFLSTKKKGFALVHEYSARDPTLTTRTWKVMTQGKYVKNPNLIIHVPKSTEI